MDNNVIPVTVGQYTTWCLIDTGAHISCINPNFLKELPMTEVRRVKAIDIQEVRLADGKVVPITERVEVKFKITQKEGRKNKLREFRTKFYIIEGLTHDLLLGTDFLSEHKAVIDFSRRTIAFKPLNVCVKEEITIPARSEAVNVVSLTSNVQVPENCIGVLHGCPRIGRTNLIAARVLTRVCNGKVMMRIANPTVQSITLSVGTKVGSFEMLPPQAKVINMTSSKSSDSQSSPHSGESPKLVVNSIKANKGSNANDLAELDKLLNLSQSMLTPPEQETLQELLHKYRDVFALNDGELGCAVTVKHKINLVPGATPISLRPYRTNPHQKKIIEQQVKQMLEAGVIEESRSAWAAPVVLVQKPGGQPPRFCVDYRQLNQRTLPDSYPMPRVDEALDSIGQAQPKYFTTLDLRSGYWQIAMDDKSKELTAFVSSAGLHHFRKMPFGLRCAPATFQRLMSDLFRTMNWKNVLIYLDDIILFSNSFQQHLQHIEEVLQKLRQADLKLKPQKCHFAKSEVNYLGHVVNSEGIRPDPVKCAAIQEAKRPFNLRTLRAFLGLCNYYRKFIRSHSSIARPLHHLLQKDIPFVWSDDCEKAFQTLKSKLISPPILGYPNFDKPFKVYTDASGDAVGAILSQEQEGTERVIAYSGRAMNKHEQNYGITEKEALAVITAIKSFDPYLRNNSFTIITDHSALKWLFGTRKNEPVGRLGRWILFLQQYNFDVVHRAGVKHQNADGLSRSVYEPHPADAVLEDLPQLYSLNSKSTGQSRVSQRMEQTNVLSASDSQSHSTSDRKSWWPDSQRGRIREETQTKPTGKLQVQPTILALTGKQSHSNNEQTGNSASGEANICTEVDMGKLQQQDPYCQPILAYKLNGTLPEDKRAARKIILEADDYLLIDGILHHLWYAPGKGPKEERVVKQLVLPLTLRERVLAALHDSPCAGHYGIARTSAVARMRYFWKGQLDDIASWVKSCKHCSQKKGAKEKHRAPLCPLPIVGAFERWNIDCIGPLTTTKQGNKYIVLATDSLTKWPVAEATPDI